MDVKAEAAPEAIEAAMDAPTDATEAELARADADVPRRQLSLDLIRTFMRINSNYYKKRGLGPDGAAPSAAKRALAKAGGGKQQASVDHYAFAVNGDELFHNGRYRSSGKRMGMGAFGVVAEAVDTQTGRKVAIKVVKAHKRFTEHAQMEIALLKMLQETGSGATKHIVQLLDSFMHGEHQCLVFELLGPNLYDVLRSSKMRGLSFKNIRKFSKQILTVLEFLKHPRIDVIHCDLKPENILLVQHGHSQLKLIDFGSSCFKQKQMYKYIQSRFYRAPEVLLGLPYTTAIDMWSLGCILVEMHTGKPLFPGYDKHDQMTRIINVLGMVPDDLIRKANLHYRTTFFDEFPVTEGGKRWTQYRVKVHKAPPAKASVANAYPSGPTNLAEILRTSAKYDLDGMHADDQYDLFQDFVSQMLHYDPDKRITPTQALQHPFMEGARRMSPEFERKTKKVRYTKKEEIQAILNDFKRKEQQQNAPGLDKRPRQGD